MSADPFEALRNPAPAFSTEQALTLLHQHYAFSGDLEPLVSERDQNFLVSVADGTKCVLKFANSAEAAEVTDLQNQALRHIARARPDFPVPNVIPTQDDELMFPVTSDAGTTHQVRLLSWLGGIPLHDAPGVTNVAAQMGSCLARLGLALKRFHHAASDYALQWDIRRASNLVELLPYVSDAGLQDLCTTQLTHFGEAVKPRLDTLRAQVIHNDMNPGNVLVDSGDNSRLAGVIDFGDIVHSQLVNDVAIAAAYLCRIDDDPFAEIMDFLAAYTKIVPLTDDEISLLPELILMRRLTTVMIAQWRATLHPENRDYILRDATPARQMLELAASLSTEEACDRFRGVCYTESEATSKR